MTTSTATMRIPVVTGITAGRGIPDDYTDWAITSFRDVRMIETADPYARFAGVPVQGDSLKEQGILDGDLLIMRITQDYEDGKIGVWQTPHGRTAKYAYYDSNHSVVLHNENGWRQAWDASELRLLGVVVRVERDMD
jgi:SOS-response transcriptional repressor LexA